MPIVRDALPSDWPTIARIYAEGIATGVATFETTVPSWEEWDARHAESPRLVAEDGGELVGWVAISPVSRREVYRGVVEHSVYVAERARGRGVGRALLDALVAAAPRHGYGRSRRPSSRRTRRASRSTCPRAFASSADASGSRDSPASGATRCCSSFAFRSPKPDSGHTHAIVAEVAGLHPARGVVWRRRTARLLPRMTGAGAATASLARSQWLSPEVLAEHQAALHGRLVRRAGRRRGAFGRSIWSSGTGGSPSRARWSVEAMRWQDAAEARARDWVGAGDGRSRLWVCCNPADRLRHVGAYLGNTRIVAAGELARDDAGRSAMVEEIAHRPPDVIQGVSNILAALADELERRDVSLPGTICISAGNHLTPWYRRTLEAVFARSVRERYAASEVGLIASSCERGTLHVHAENLLVEILGLDGAVLPPGALGEIAVTMLRNSAAPAVRRRVGDVGRLLTAPCGCGRGLPTIELLGRVSEQIRAGGGRVVSPAALFEAADDPTLAEACFHHRRTARSLHVAIRRKPDAVAPDLTRMADRLEQALGPGTSVEIREGGRLSPASSGKLALVTVSD